MSKHKAEPSADPAPAVDAAPVTPAAAEPAAPPATPPEPPPAAPPISEQALAALQTQAAQAQQYYDQLLRTTAELDNFKKRTTRERAEAIRLANETLLRKLVPVLDNFEMAMAAAAAPNTTVAALQAGVGMIHQQLKAALADSGLEEVDATQKVFDPNLHEAVSQEESADVKEGHVLRQLRKGYKLRDRLLRPASVVVAKTPPQTPLEQPQPAQ
jgi:molecular chaperone GrpE